MKTPADINLKLLMSHDNKLESFVAKSLERKQHNDAIDAKKKARALRKALRKDKK